MKTLKPLSFRPFVAISAICLFALCHPSYAATLSWSGGGGANANWNNDANWGFAGIPADGDTLIFSAGQPNLVNTNNIANLTINLFRFVEAGGGYSIRGNAFTLVNGIAATNTAGANTISNNVAFISIAQPINVGSGASLTLSGVLSGSVGLTKSGGGLLTLAGPNSNTYLGTTTVNGGSIDLNKIGFPPATAIAGDLIIGDGVAACTVRNLANLEIADTSNVRVNDSSTWNLNGWSETVNGLTLTSASVTTGAGTLTVGDNTISVSGAGTSSIAGNLSVGAGTFTIQGSGTVFISAVMSGSANIVRNGDVSVGFSAANSFTGSVTANGTGYFWISNHRSLGAAGGGITLNDSAWLAINNNINVTNETLTLNSSNSGALYIYSASVNSWNGPVVLAAQAQVQVLTSCALDIIGEISGTAGITKSGPGRLIYSGTAANSYAGTTAVNDGVLELHKTSTQSIPAGQPLVIGDGVGGVDADVVRQTLGGSQIFVGSVVTINSSGLYDLNGFNDDVGPFTLNGGDITTGVGTLTLADDVTVPAMITNASTINGLVTLNGTRTLEVAASDIGFELSIPAQISGSGAIVKDGTGELLLTGANTFSGLVTINNGVLFASHNSALGATNAGTIVQSNGTLAVQPNIHVGLEPLTLDSIGGSAAASLASFAGIQSNSWAGSITLARDTTVRVDVNATLNLIGPITGPGALTKSWSGTLYFGGGTANSYAGNTIVREGTLVLNKPAFTLAVPGNLVINNGATTRLANEEQTADSADVLVNGGGLFDFSTFSTYMDTLHGTGSVNFGVGGWIWIGLNNGTSTFDGLFTGVGYAPGWTVGKTGSGTFTMNGNNTFSAGNITIQGAGTTVINGTQPQAHVRILDSSTTLGGTGTVGIITAPGNISPGTSPGILTSSNVAFTASADYYVELNGPTAGTDYDQLNVRGTNNLAGATLHVTADFTSPVGVGSQFTIINNDGGEAITGTFGGLPQGSPITSGFYTFTLSYTGGSGNDLVLTLTNVPGAAAGSAVASGNGDGAIGANECNYLSIVISNKTGTAMTNVTATLASLTAGAAITQPFSPYPNIAGNNQSANAAAFQISTTTNFVCGTNINLLLSVTTSTHGSFAIPLVMPTGQPAAVALRYNNNSVTNVPDIGTIESTNTVGSWSGAPIAKVAVSLWLVASFSADMTLSLIAPDGTPVLLSSGNGAGANFGTGSADGSRTTFDDAAASSITTGASPFVGTFRPQTSLANLLASNPVGNWRLRIQDSFGSGSPDTLRAWSLFLYPVECAPGSGLCELCPDITIFSALEGSSLVASDRLTRDGVASTCGAPKVCPGPLGGDSPFYDAYTFRNGPSNACITVTLKAAPTADLFSAAYLGSFSPTDNCSNYLADAGDSTGFSSASRGYSFNVASGAVFVVEVNSIYGSTGSYQLTVSGGDCRPVLNLTSTGANQAVLDWTTAAAGYVLERTNNLVAGPVWQPVTNEPAVINSRFTVTNTIFPSNQFYRLRKPLP